MERIKRALVVMVAVAAGVVATTQAQAFAERAASPSAPVTTRDIGGSAAPETKFVPISPCRIYDTRQGQGQTPIGAGNFRILKVRQPEDITGQFRAQGGREGGCGVPKDAAAIEATVTAVSAAGTGLLRLWPSGQPETTSTFLNYMRGFNPTNTGAVDICDVGCGTASDLRVKAFGSATHVVIEVQGYYIKPMAAYVNVNGGLVRGSRVVSSVRPLTGQYRVQFDRPVDQCIAVATTDGTVGNGWAQVGPDSADNTRIYVFTFDLNGTLANRAFNVVLTC